MKAIPITIANTQTKSPWVDTWKLVGNKADNTMGLVQLLSPSALGDITSLDIEFSETGSGDTDASALYGADGTKTTAIAVSAYRRTYLDPSVYAGIPRYMRLKANTAANANRAFTLFAREV